MLLSPVPPLVLHSVPLPADDAVAVADLQGGDLKLHLRTMVEVEGHSGWYTTPLN